MPTNQKGIAQLLVIGLVILGIGAGLYLVQNPAIFNPHAAGGGGVSYEPQATPFPRPLISDSGETCTLGENGQCTVYLRWNSNSPSISQYQPNGLQPLTIGVRENPGTVLASSTSGSMAIPWVTASGVTFEVYVGSQLVDTLFIKGVEPTGNRNGMSITASPNPCTLNSSGVCTSTISWNAFENPSAKVTIREVPGSVFSTIPTGSQAAPWINATGATFDLYVWGVRQGSVFVKGVPAGTTITPSPTPRPSSIQNGLLNASPNPCSLGSGPTCTTYISWDVCGSTINHGRAYLALPITLGVRDNPGAVIANACSQTVPVPWITAQGATFELYSNGRVIDTLFVKGTGQGSTTTPPSSTGILSASPNPCTITSGETCTSKITWNSNYPDLRITIREVPGSVFAQAAYGSQDAPWIRATGATFDAYSGGTLVDSLFVKGQ